MVPYSSLADAVASFPTTETSIALCKTDTTCEVIAPCGLNDLFAGILRL
ncbi:MAG TPA: hypothetical protein DCE33_09235 [Rhodospirillaceae bacterium]|nr:hypothetical protein [Rhodospirillaceae bacterium]